MFTLNGIEHSYASRTALAVASWRVAQAEQWLLTGPSGSGKTTLLHVLAGILRPAKGSVSVAGQDLGALSASALDRFRGRTIGIVLQRLHLVGSLTVEGNLRLARYCADLPQDDRRIAEVLADLGIGDKAQAYPHELSHGEAQRVAVARAVLNRPKLILADEPTSNLDDAHCEQALRLLLEQAQHSGATLLIATHDARLKSRVERQMRLPAPA